MLGVAVIVLTWASVLSVLVVPRQSSDRLSRLMYGCVDRLFRAATSRGSSYRIRDRLLAGEAPAMILLHLAVWLLLFYCGFGLVLQSFDSTEPGTPSPRPAPRCSPWAMPGRPAPP